MAIDWQRLIGSGFAVRAAAALGGLLPPALGFALADGIAAAIAARRTSRIVRAVRANQWVAGGETLGGAELDRATAEALRGTARSAYELYRGLRFPQEAQRLLVLDPGVERLVRRPDAAGRGLVVAGLHLGNFDLILHLLSLRGVKALILTIPDPRGGRRAEFESRERAGAVLLPASVPAFRNALRRLQQGGLVATGIDRPIPDPRIRPLFFGRPAALPLHHVFLAARARVPVVLLATLREPDGRHRVFASDPLEMDSDPDREREARRNGEKVLRAAEAFIRRAPAQWSVSLPVWPDVRAP